MLSKLRILLPLLHPRSVSRKSRKICSICISIFNRPLEFLSICDLLLTLFTCILSAYLTSNQPPSLWREGVCRPGSTRRQGGGPGAGPGGGSGGSKQEFKKRDTTANAANGIQPGTPGFTGKFKCAPGGCSWEKWASFHNLREEPWSLWLPFKNPSMWNTALLIEEKEEINIWQKKLKITRAYLWIQACCAGWSQTLPNATVLKARDLATHVFTIWFFEFCPN